MSRLVPMHPVDMGKLYSSTLENLRWARITELMGHGASEREADLFARLEIEKKKLLASQIGPERALLSGLHHEFIGERGWYSIVRYEAPPEDLWSNRFEGFRD